MENRARTGDDLEPIHVFQNGRMSNAVGESRGAKTSHLLFIAGQERNDEIGLTTRFSSLSSYKTTSVREAGHHRRHRLIATLNQDIIVIKQYR